MFRTCVLRSIQSFLWFRTKFLFHTLMATSSGVRLRTRAVSSFVNIIILSIYRMGSNLVGGNVSCVCLIFFFQNFFFLIDLKTEKNVQVYIPWQVVRSNAPLYKHPFGCDGMLSIFAVQKHSVPYSGPISLRKLSPVWKRTAGMPL